MTHPLALYAVQAHMNDLVAEATAHRQAKQARQARGAGFMASLLTVARNHRGSNDTQRAASPA
jgi:hypothetical protein